MSQKRRKKRLTGKHNPALSRKDLKRKAVDLMGGKCFVCHYDRYLANLSFHHRDPSKKEFGISRLISSIPWEAVQFELERCILLCIRCHSEAHAGLLDGYDLFDGYVK